MHAVHRGIVHAGHRDAEDDGAERQTQAALAGEVDLQAPIGRGNGNDQRQRKHGVVVFDGEISGKPVDADIEHRVDAEPEQ